MDSKKAFEKYHARLVKEAIIKSLLCGVAIGMGLASVLALVFWLTGFKYFWISVLIGVAAVGALTPVFYFKRFHPTNRTVAQRIDNLGLEERIITMTELEGDDSYIAQRQREDAKAALAALGGSGGKAVVPMKMSFSKSVITLASVAAAAYVGVTTLSILGSAGLIPSMDEVWNNVVAAETQYNTVSYLCYGFGGNLDMGGYIEGDVEQVVATGESSESVKAVPDDEWFFYDWVVYVNTPMEDVLAELNSGVLERNYMLEIMFGKHEVPEDERYEFNVIDNLTVVAVFMGVSDPGEGDGEGEPGDGEPGDPGDPNGEPGNGNGNGENGGIPAPPSGSNNGQGDGDSIESEGEGAGGGDSIQDNTFMDGETPIEDFLWEYYELAMKLLAEGKELPEDLRRIIEAYFGGL
ncbi:MAG: hypothetical protein J1F71_00165 [Clostridiales bacterium]|nr:hypothetical protein [Clostridiales bacterium]